MTTSLHWIVPGPLDQRTGGYIYDRRIVESLRASGWAVQVYELDGRFPDADDDAIRAAGMALEDIGDGLTVIDGLALLAFHDHGDRLPEDWVGLIHHPLAMETGLSADEMARFATVEGRLMYRATKLIVTSPGTRRDLTGFDIDPAGVAVVLPGVDPAPPARRRGDEGTRQLLTVGSLTRRKGHLTLLEALSNLRDLDWQLDLVGSAAWDPKHADEIEQAIPGFGLDGRVILHGEQDEAALADAYHQADLFVLASHHEGYGMVLTEALARGLPIVSTTAGAIPETVPAGAGRLVPPDDAQALADALRELLTDADAYRQLAEGAAEARETLPSWKKAAQQFASLLDEVASP